MYLLPLLHNTYIRPLILSRIELLFNFVFWFLFCYNTRLSVFFCFRNDYCTLVKGSSFSSFYGRNPGYTVIANLEVLWFPCKTLPRWNAGICSLGKCPNRHGKYLVLNLMFSWKCHKCYCGAVRKVCYCGGGTILTNGLSANSHLLFISDVSTMVLRVLAQPKESVFSTSTSISLVNKIFPL